MLSLRIGVLLLVGALAVACGASDPFQGRSCTEIGCVDGLRIAVTAASWPAGEYQFHIEADGVTQDCTGSLPLRACDQGPSLACGGPKIALITESGCALPASAHSFGDITLRSGPANVSIKVERDGVPIGSTTLTPTYQTTRPNGPQCEPVCRQANGTLALGS